LAEDMDFELLHGIIDCLWVISEPISEFKELVEKETDILMEVDSYDWNLSTYGRWIESLQPLIRKV
jgi:DNA polymerase, archaea type